MRKRIFAVLLAVALLVTVGVVAVFATENVATVSETEIKCPCHGMTLAEIDASEDKGWVEFAGALENGVHYRLTAEYNVASSGTTMVTLAAESNVKTILNLNGNTLTNSRSAGGRLLSIADSEVTICGGGEIKGGGNGGGVIYMNAGAIVNLYDTTLTNTRSAGTTSGGVIDVYGEGAEFNMYSGTLNAGNLNANGGAVRVYYGHFNMHDGVINGSTNAVAKLGGAIYVGNYDSAALNIYGGTINGSAFTGNGDALYVNPKATFNVEGGTINGETYCKFITVSGDPVINNLELVSDSLVTLGEGGLTGGSIGMTVAADTVITAASENAATSAKYFYGVAARLKAQVNDDTTITMVENTWCEACQADATWTSWNGASIANTTSGDHFYLVNGNVSTSGRVLFGTTDVVQEMCVDYNGYSIHKAGNVCNVYLRPGTTVNLMNAAPRISRITSEMSTGNNGALYTEKSATNGCTLNLYDGIEVENVYNGTLAKQATLYIATTCTVNMHGGTIIGHDNSATSGAISVSGTFNMDGGHIIGADAAAGGAIQVNYSGAEVNISGDAVIDGGELTTGNGGAIYVTTGTVTVSGGTINGSTIAGNGGAIAASGGGASVVIEGGTINGGTANYGGAIYLESSSSLTMTGGTVTGGAAQQGGNIYITASTADISGGTVSLGKTNGSTYGGGNILTIGSATELTISGTASIEDGYADASSKDNNRGGGNIIIVGGTVNVNGGTVKDGGTDASGGNIMTRGGTLNISGGTISGGTAGSGANYGGDSIALRDNTTVITGGTINSITPVRDGYTSLTISGAPTIASLDLVGHVNDGIAPVVTLGEGGVTGGSINVVATQDVPFTAANAELAESSCQYFHDAAAVLTVSVVDGCLVLIDPPVICPHCGQAVEWVEWNGNKDVFKVAIDPNTHYVLTQNKNTGGQIAVGANATASAAEITNTIIIDLNGYDLTNTGRVFAIYAGSTLNLVNTSETESVLTGAYTADDGGVINMTGASNLTMEGKISAKSTAADFAHIGGIVNVADGTFILEDGVTLYGQNATRGGAIHVTTGTLTMNGGTVSGGTADTYGGAIGINGGSFYLNGGIVTGGRVENATKIPYGGNIYCAGDFIMTGGTVSDGTSAATSVIARGGNVYLAGAEATHTISGGIIEGGVAENGNGGNVYLGAGTLNISGDVEITNGESCRAIAHSNGGGNVYGLNGTTINITGGTITNGTTASLGCNVFSRGNVTISSAATISGGTSEYEFGGEVAISGGELTIEGLGDAWSGRITTTNEAVITNDTVGAAVTHYNEGRAYYVWYASLDEVKDEIAAGGENNYVTVTKDSETPVDMSGLVVDLNGSNAVITGDAIIFDSSNDDYEGYGIVTMESAPATSYVAPNGYMYISVSEGENKYSFHRVEMGFENISLRPSTGGIYFSSSWNCDDILSGKLGGDLQFENGDPIILGYGLALKKGSAATGDSFTNGDKFAYTFFDNVEGDAADMLFNSKGDEKNSCLLNNIISTSYDAATNQENAQVDIYVTPYAQIINSNGVEEYVMGDTYFNDMKGIVEYFVETINAMEAGTSKDKFVAGMTSFYETWSATDAYGLNDFFTGLESLVVPAE